MGSFCQAKAWRLQGSVSSLILAKDQENTNFRAFDTSASLTNSPIFDPGRFGKRSDGTEISKWMAFLTGFGPYLIANDFKIDIISDEDSHLMKIQDEISCKYLLEKFFII